MKPSREKNKKIQLEGIGSRLRELRSRTKLSLRKFAEEYEVTYSLWSDYENDRRKPNATTIEKLCERFGVTADWIIRGHSARGLNHPPTEGELLNVESGKDGHGPKVGSHGKRRKKRA